MACEMRTQFLGQRERRAGSGGGAKPVRGLGKQLPKAWTVLCGRAVRVADRVGLPLASSSRSPARSKAKSGIGEWRSEVLRLGVQDGGGLA
jgi:hypothetical protein